MEPFDTYDTKTELLIMVLRVTPTVELVSDVFEYSFDGLTVVGGTILFGYPKRLLNEVRDP